MNMPFRSGASMPRPGSLESKPPSRFLKSGLSVGLAVLLAGSVGTSIYFWNLARNFEAKVLEVGAATAAAEDEQKQVQELLAALGKLIVLPEGEDPTIATVSDPESLKDQPFFSRAKIGDKVIIYSKAGKIILFDPVANQIVDVAPMNVSPSAETAANATSVTTKKK